MPLTSVPQTLTQPTCFFILMVAIGCGDRKGSTTSGNVQSNDFKASMDWNAIDDITIYYLGYAGGAIVPEQDYDKQKLIDAFHKLKWTGPADVPPPPMAPFWKIAARSNGKKLFNIYVPDKDHFFVTKGSEHEHGRIAAAQTCWSMFRADLTASKGEYANLPPWYP